VRLLTSDNREDFGRHVIPYAINLLDVKAFKFHGYWEDIGTIKAFFRSNLALTDPFPEFDLYHREKPIYTRPRYLPPSKVNGCAIQQSMICEGCIIDTCEIERSIIGIRSKISPGCMLRNVVMMGADFYQTLQEIDIDRSAGSPNVGIGANTTIENAIIDKNARIGNDCVITPEGKPENVDHPMYFIRDGVVIIPKNGVIPHGTVI